VPLTEPVIAILKSLPRIAGRGFIFTTTGDTPVSGFSRAKASLDELMSANSAPRQTGIEPWILHDLRRTCASGMAALDIAPHVIEAVLNHKSGTIKGVAAVYNRHRYAAEKREALEVWARRISEIIKGPNRVVAFRARS
jgi:integrase